MVHLESRNIDQENKRIEIGCKGRFACVKPFCFTSFLSNYLILDKTDSFFPNLCTFWRKSCFSAARGTIGSFERQLNNEPLESSFFVVLVYMESQCGWGKSTARAVGFYSSRVSIGQPFSFLAFRSLWPKSIQQPFIEANVRVFGGLTM